MKYPITTAIDEFHSLLTIVGGRTTQAPEYAELKAIWPGLLQFLQPIVSGERLFSAEAMEHAPHFQREQTSVTDKHATERAIYFGLMWFTIIMFNKLRNRYAQLNIDDVAKAWLAQAATPMDSLQSYGKTIRSAIPKIEALGNQFLIRCVQPHVTNPERMDDALGWFATQFISGALLGQITDYLIFRAAYYDEHGGWPSE